MLLEEEAAAQANTSGSDDEEMKNPPKEVAEEVELHLGWERARPNVNERANCNGAEANEDVDMDVPEFKLVSNVYIL